MQLNLPDEVVDEAGLTAETCLIELAVQLYSRRKLSLARSLQLCGLTRFQFEQELASRNVSLYTVDDLHSDLAAIRELDAP